MGACDAIIDDYVRTLGSRLRGPARRKADLMTEVRHGLEDAAETYVGHGLERRVALAPRVVVRPLAGLALVTCGLILAFGTVAAVGTVVESPQALTWPPMIAAWVMLDTTFGAMLWYATRALAATRVQEVAA